MYAPKPCFHASVSKPLWALGKKEQEANHAPDYALSSTLPGARGGGAEVASKETSSAVVIAWVTLPIQMYGVYQTPPP